VPMHRRMVAIEEDFAGSLRIAKCQRCCCDPWTHGGRSNWIGGSHDDQFLIVVECMVSDERNILIRLGRVFELSQVGIGIIRVEVVKWVNRADVFSLKAHCIFEKVDAQGRK